MIRYSTLITPELRALRERFVASGFDVRLVGGYVRDTLWGAESKDIDLCTDADPDEQATLYKSAGITFYETGVQHGTLTVNLGGGQVYEITSLRTESNHDGRHASVTWTKDWTADLGRRDLTINAMAMAFDGRILDPFDGANDLRARRVRFVGEARQRVAEDYLRILRFVRFHARFAGDAPFDEHAHYALIAGVNGLRSISRERIWLELAKIIAGPHGPLMISRMDDMGIAYSIDLPAALFMHRLVKAHPYSRNPVTLMTAMIGPAIEHTGGMLRWSAAERQLGKFLGEHMHEPLTLDHAKALLAAQGAPREHVAQLALLLGDPDIAGFARLWDVPDFPVTGFDVMQAGLAVQGPAMGRAIRQLKAAWVASDYQLGKEALLRSVTV
jgi:hypothetical protein